MTAAVAPLPIALHLPDSSLEARKRRREILTSSRCSTTLELSVKCATVTQVPEGQVKRRKVSESSVTTKVKPGKKPQMKYDPDVPMTKEDAAAWRREQRRKRNRESAAASRQRQRDRIAELEVEVDDWKTKFEAMMGKIKKLEKATGKKAVEFPRPEQSQPFGESVSKFVSPPSSPGHSPLYSPVASPICSSSLVIHTVKVTPKEGLESPVIGGVEQELTDKMISRQAVKITDAPKLPLLPTSEYSILPPDTCLSSNTEVKLEPIDSALFPVKEDKLPPILTDEENEDEFGEFLLDAVQWL